MPANTTGGTRPIHYGYGALPSSPRSIHLSPNPLCLLPFPLGSAYAVGIKGQKREVLSSYQSAMGAGSP